MNTELDSEELISKLKETVQAVTTRSNKSCYTEDAEENIKMTILNNWDIFEQLVKEDL